MCFGNRDDGSPATLQLMSDALMPHYQHTDIEELEQRRQQIFVSLAGQFIVVLFRFLTGHWTSGAIGLVIFCAGQRARCSLQPVSLTSYIMLGFGASFLDSVDLLHNVLMFGTSFFVLPLEYNLTQDLFAISLVMAPIVEVTGARCAWGSFLTADMVLSPKRVAQHPQQLQYYASPPVPPSWGGQVGWFQQPLLHPPPGGWWHGSGASASNGEAPEESHPAPWRRYLPTWMMGSSPQKPRSEVDDGDTFDGRSDAASSVNGRRNRRSTRSTGGDSYQRHGLMPTEPAPELHWDGRDKPCSQCNEPVPEDEAKVQCGTGHYRNHVYCNRCWSHWSNPGEGSFLN